MPALLRRDGRVIATTGNAALVLEIPSGSYRVAVKHRNHLGVITFGPHVFDNSPTTVDVMSALGAQVNPFAIATGPDGTRMLFMGDVNSDKTVIYSGAGNDRDLILSAIGGVIPTHVLDGEYRWEDINMDGEVRYTGARNDRDLILQVIGGSTPTNTRTQVPVY
jgi:hypothetical protein